MGQRIRELEQHPDGSIYVLEDEREGSSIPGDRREAIAHAVSMAHRGDTVVVAGKGHERGQEVAGVVHPFDDRDVLAAAIDERLGAVS